MSQRPPALSASRAKDYLQCPLKFRYSTIDGIPQPPTEATFKGTVVHLVLERLFDLPAADRTPEQAQSLLPAAWADTMESEKGSEDLFPNANQENRAYESTKDLVANYFHLERPQNLHPRGREEFLDARLDNGILLRGIVDRIDQAPDGALRVVDYKTGKSPHPRFVNEALFQMRFYALLLQQAWQLPKRMQLLYLRDGQVLTLDPQAQDIERFALDVEDLWRDIEADALAGEFKPKTSRLCDWCAYQDICPAFGGTEPEIPEAGRARLLAVRQSTDEA